MKRQASISHDETIIRRLRKDPDFAAEYLRRLELGRRRKTRCTVRFPFPLRG
jgi:hypothetical protein